MDYIIKPFSNKSIQYKTAYILYMNSTEFISLCGFINIYLIFILVLLFKFTCIVKLGPTFVFFFHSFLFSEAMKAAATDVRTWRDFPIGPNHDPG